MRRSWFPRYTHAFIGTCGALLVTACVPAVPADLLTAIEAIDHELIALRAPEAASDEYAHFIREWVFLKAHVESEDDLIRWPWESSDMEARLRRLQEEGGATVARMQARQAADRALAHTKLTLVEERLQLIASRVGSIDGRIVLGQNPIHADLLLKQARSFYEQKDYRRSMDAADQAGQALVAQTAVLTRELGRYADDKRIAHWQLMAKETIEWSRTHQSTAIVVSKADRVLTLYKNGHKIQSHPVRLGFNGIREKQYQGDGATPEGRYRVAAKRGRGETQFYRALVLDYPNAEDRRRFAAGQTSGKIGTGKSIGGQIEIHGGENAFMAQTLGCIMLDNPHMATLFDRVAPGTPVTIVGALTGRNSVALVLAQLGNGQEET
ncbi:MAG: L,D-transpeptidase [Nitrospiraceae bacterium]|nr:L,D-transpeptidase [Nitrospiraceae bacterium]